MRKNSIAVGTFVWWRRIGNSTNQNISCPGIISKVSKTGFHVITFDDMKEIEVEISFDSEIFKDEFKVITQKRALKFHQKRTNALRAKMAELREKSVAAEIALMEHTTRAENHWRNSSLFPFLRGFETA